MLRHLSEVGDEVVCMDDSVDVTDGAALRAALADADVDAVCHLAAQASVSASWSDPGRTWSVNTLGAVNLLDAAAACRRPPRVLLVSSAEVYGRVAPADLPLVEDRPPAPVNPYAASKAAAELAGLQAWRAGQLEVVTARPFNHTGPGQRPDFVVPALARQVAEAAREGRSELLVGNLGARRDLTDVRDVVRAYRMLLEQGSAGGVYNVCRGQSVAIADVASRLLALAGLEVPMRVDPARLRPVDVADLRGDPGRLRAATGWEPELDLDRTLADMLDYWLGALSA